MGAVVLETFNAHLGGPALRLQVGMIVDVSIIPVASLSRS